jgi:outer membrane protein W
MKKYLLLSLLLAFSVVTAHAYAPKRKAKATKQSTADAMKFGIQLGGIFGLFGEYKFTEQIGLQSGLGFAFASHKSTKDDPKYTFYYLRLPLYAKYYLGETKRFGIFGGINALYCLTGNRKENNSQTDFKDLAEDEKVNSYDMSISVGFDYETTSGFIWGLKLPDIGLINAVEQPKAFKNIYTDFLILGFNFAKLL